MPLIVVAEDQDTLRELITEILETDGYQVKAFETGDSAWEYLSNSDKGADLIFTDVRMPGKLNGLDLASLARQKFPAIPIVISSGYYDQIDSSKIAGDDPVVLPKPWSLPKFQEVCSFLAPLG